MTHMPKKSTSAISLLLIAALLVAACAPLSQPVLQPPAGSSSAGSAAALDGTSWTLDSMGDQPVAGGATITAEFAGGQLGGSSGCNSYSASYQAAGGTLSLGPIAMTEMACLEAGLMEQEQAYLAALQSATAYRLAGDTLQIDSEAGVLAFQAQQPVSDAALENSEWLLTTFIQGDVAMSLLAGSEITALFAGGQVSGNAGCNDYMAEVKVDGGRLAVGPLGMTKKLCEEGLMQQEMAYAQALQSARSYQISGNSLEVVHAGGALAFTAR